MATKKGLCPYCRSLRVDRRIFPVNPEASTCFCPTCMREIAPKKAIDDYIEYISQQLKIADKTLFVTCDPVLAYQQYASVIELEPKEAHALLGRILCLVYMGKVRKSYLKEALTLLEATSYEGCDIADYVFFLKKINFALDEYDSSLQKKLTFRGFYYDIDCLRLYFTHFYDIILLKELLLEIVENIKSKYSSQQNEVLINLLKHNVDEKHRLLRQEVYTADGVSYKFVKIANDQVELTKTNHDVDSRLSRYRLATLDDNDKKNRRIKDEVFKDYTRIQKAKNAALFFSILFFLAMGGFVAAAILFKKEQWFFYSFIAAAVVFFAFAVLFLINFLYWRYQLNKRKLRID